MAVIAIILSCVLGTIAGIVQFTLLGAGLGQAFMTYLGVSIALSSVILTVAFAQAHRSEASGRDRELADLEAWQDWQTEEYMEAARQLGASSEAEAEHTPEKRRSA